MATGGMSDLERNSDETFDILCSKCKEKDQNKNTEAVTYCYDCFEFYCSTCIKVHCGVFHTIIELAEFQFSPSDHVPAVPTDRCTVHGYKPLDMFCRQHDTVGSDTCMVVNHRQMGSTASKTRDEENKILTLYLENFIENELEFKRNDNEISEIKFGVEVLVSRIAWEIGIVDPKCKIRSHVLVGSILEETKIHEPDEFDYVFVLKELSKSDAVTIMREPQCKDRRGYAHVFIENEDLREKWKQWSIGHFLRSTECSGVGVSHEPGFKNVFQSAVKKAVKNVYECYCPFESDSGVISIKDPSVKRHGPACKLTFCWVPKLGPRKELDIDIDITPAIEHNLTKDIVLDTDVFDASLMQRLKETGTFWVTICGRNKSCISSSGNRFCFRLSFTETEIKFFDPVKSKSTICIGWSRQIRCRQHHIKCYKVLKYIFGGQKEDDTVFSSYALKTLLIKHMCHCTETEMMALCVKDILDECGKLILNGKPSKYSAAFTLKIPSLFIESHNIFDGTQFTYNVFPIYIVIMKTKKSLDEIAKMKDWKKGSIRTANNTKRYFHEMLIKADDLYYIKINC